MFVSAGSGALFITATHQVLVGGMLRPAVAADQAVISVVAAIRLVLRIGAGNVSVIGAVWAVISVWVISAVRAIVRVGTWLIARSGVIGAIVRVIPRVF